MTVNLSKGQKVSLAKPGGGALARVRMGLGWAAVKKRGLFGRVTSQSIDLDASCLLFDASGHLVDQVWFRQLKSKDGAVVHTGDNLTGGAATGAAVSDDESIIVDLQALGPSITTLVFVVNSFTGQTFSQIERAHCRLIDELTGAELAGFHLAGSGPHTAQIMAKVTREPGGWAMSAIGAIANGRTFRDLLPAVEAHL
ncbi:MAG: tellurium resistance TerZ family protein [Micromonosporaceae bacterium]|nr:tellurium resistance TerZ family protein [Micromonosporaceae bacterium]